MVEVKLRELEGYLPENVSSLAKLDNPLSLAAVVRSVIGRHDVLILLHVKE